MIRVDRDFGFGQVEARKLRDLFDVGSGQAHGDASRPSGEAQGKQGRNHTQSSCGRSRRLLN
jgi:hypothetical protein